MAQKQAEQAFTDTFKTLYEFDVTPYVKHIQMGGREVSYVPWATAWRLVREIYPDTTYFIWVDESTKQPFFESKFGVFVCVTVTVKERRETDWYEVEPDSSGNITTFEIANAHQRALVKCLGRHGFGLKLWEGLDQWRTKAPASDRKITEAQAKRLYAIAMKSGHNEPIINGMLEKMGYKTALEIPMSKYEDVVSKFQK